jgi:hypothetical protein
MNFRNAREKGCNSLTLKLAGDDPLVPGHRLQHIPIAGLWESQPSTLVRALGGTNHSFALWVTFAGSALKNFVCQEMFAERGGSFRGERLRRLFEFAIRCKKPNFLVNLGSTRLKKSYFMAEIENPSNGGNVVGEQIL